MTLPVSRFAAPLRLALAITGLALALPQGSHADPIADLLAGGAPVPQRRPSALLAYGAEASQVDAVKVGTVAAKAKSNDGPLGPVTAQIRNDVAPVEGDLKSGLDALQKDDGGAALAILAGMEKTAFDRKVLAWAIALSGAPGVRSAEIAAIAEELADWPGQRSMRINAEAALAGEGLDARQIVAAFGERRPESVAGAIALAKAKLSLGDAKGANAAIARLWREDRLMEATEKKVLAEAGAALTRDDHRVRMHRQFYRERSKDALRMAAHAGQAELAKAWAAVNREDAKAQALIDAVPQGQRSDPAYLFIAAKQARKAGDPAAAAKLLAQGPREASRLVDPAEWWVERRLVSRELLDKGDAAGAYGVAASGAIGEPATVAEAEFHAGWYALRFLDQPGKSVAHFERILKASATPITQARANYWLGRASGPVAGAKYFAAAARHNATYYGQLAAQAIGRTKLDISDPRPGPAERATFAQRELVRAIAALEGAGHAGRADILYRELAERLAAPGELALLAAQAERRGNRTLALQIGKIAHGRGLEVDTVSWPVGAIPAWTNIGEAGRALAYAIARQESAFNAAAVSPANARGLLQLLPGTAKLMAKKTGVKYDKGRLTSDAAYNAALGSAYLSEQLDSFANSYILTFAGYNAGPGRVKEWVAAYGDPTGKPIEEVVDWVERIPFTETRNYVQRVMENYQVYKARIGQTRLDIVSDLRFGRR